MKRVISTLGLILIFSHVILTAHALAETPEGLKNTSRLERHREAMRLARTTFQSRAAMVPDGSFDINPISETWAGAVQTNIPSGEFKSIHAKWVLPQVDLPPGAGGPGSWGMNAWIGIGGVPPTCGGLLRGGSYTYFTIDGNGAETVTTTIWVAWSGAPQFIFLTFDNGLEPGQQMEATIYVYSPSSAEIVVTNLATIETQGTEISSPSADQNLCGLLADWMVEDPILDGSVLLPFPVFSPISFTDCNARTTNGDTVGLTGASLIQMVQNGVVLASVSTISDSSVTIQPGSS